MMDRPFHVYDKGFYDIIGSNPTLTLIAKSAKDPLFHEAVVWYVRALSTCLTLARCRFFIGNLRANSRICRLGTRLQMKSSSCKMQALQMLVQGSLSQALYRRSPSEKRMQCQTCVTLPVKCKSRRSTRTPRSLTPMVRLPGFFFGCNKDILTSWKGATQYRGQILFTAEGQGDQRPSALYVMNPRSPYNTTGEFECPSPHTSRTVSLISVWI